MAGSGSNPSRDKDQPSCSPSPSDTTGSEKRPLVLIVEDNKADIFLIREAMQARNLNADLHIVLDGEKAVRFFEQVDYDDSLPCPNLVIIDINLPKKQGDEVLRSMRSTRRCGKALVLVVTSSDSATDRAAMSKHGIDGYFRKPSAYDDFMKLGEVVEKLIGFEPERSSSSQL